MAFDEGYHFGLIQFFSHHLNPIITKQPAATYNLGAIAHNPSFLYHYLLGFPYRIVESFTSSLQSQVIVLRFINLFFATGSLLVMRKILRFIGINDVLANLIILAYAFTPIVTVLSSQINYDNLLILMSALSIYQALRVSRLLGQGVLDVKNLLLLLGICLFSSEVKFEFLPIFAGISVVIGWQLINYWRQDKKSFFSEFKSSFDNLSIYTKTAILAGLVVGGGLFMASYGYDIVKYHNPEPQCNQILSIQDCKQYYSWDRNYTVKQYDKAHPAVNQMNPLSYTWFWFRVAYYQLFAEIIPTGGLVYIARTFYVIVIILSLLLFSSTLINIKKVFKDNRLLMLLSFLVFSYLLALWGRNYHDYLQLGQPLAIQGRYFLPVLLYLYAVCGMGIKYALESRRPMRLIMQPALVLFIIFTFFYFGGYVRYLSNVSPEDGWTPQTANKPGPLPTKIAKSSTRLRRDPVASKV